MLKRSRDDSRDAGAGILPTTSIRQPTRRMGWLMLVSLLVMLNTHLLITAAAGIDQYSLYVADSTADRLYPSALAQKPYPVLLSFLFNLVLAVFAYWLYHRIWRHFTVVGKSAPDGLEHNPFKRNAIALAVPVAIAMLPSTVLSYTELKPYFLIAGALIVIILCIVGALNDTDVELDASTRGYWFIGAVIAIFVMMSLSVIVILYFQFAPVEPPASNILWPLEWSPDSEQFERRVRGGMLMFGMSSLAYMVAVLGGVLLATLHPPRIGPRGKDLPSPSEVTSQTPGPEPLHGAGTPVVDAPVSNAPVRVSIPSSQGGQQPEPQQGVSQPVLNIQVINMAEGGGVYPTHTEPQTEGRSARSDTAPHPRDGLPDEGPHGTGQESLHDADPLEENSRTPEPEPLDGDGTPLVSLPLDGSVEQWAREFLTQLENLPVEGGQDSSYLLVLSTGLEMRISEGQYMVLVDERSGFLTGVDLFVDRWTRTIKTIDQKDSTFKSPGVNTHPQNARYLAVCLFCRMPHRRFRTRELQTLLAHEMGSEEREPVVNMSDLLSALRGWNVPLTSKNRETCISDDAKTIYVERARTNSRAVSDARAARPFPGEAAGP